MSNKGKDKDFRPLHEKERATELCSMWQDIGISVIKWEDHWGCTRQEVVEAICYTLLGLTSRRMDERLFQHPSKKKWYLEYIIESTQRELDGLLDEDGLCLAEDKYGKDLLSLRDARNYGFDSKNFSED